MVSPTFPTEEMKAKMRKQRMNKLINKSIVAVDRLESPHQFRQRMAVSPAVQEMIVRRRQEVAAVMKGEDKRLLVIVGPCSIHDTAAGLEYADRLARLQEQVKSKLLLVMRTYFEKPRTTMGWKGMISDPDLNGRLNIKKGLGKARQFLVEIANRGLAAGIEWLDPLTPQYLGDLISWGAIGARTTESQTHRQLASGLSLPVGFKNGTGSSEFSIEIAIDGAIAARTAHAFMGADSEGYVATLLTSGNPNTHIILRGGHKRTNYDKASVQKASAMLLQRGLEPYLMVDCSHGNSQKDHRQQPAVFRDLLKQRTDGNKVVAGIMLESHLKEGRQDVSLGTDALEYGVSITDACISWETTEKMLRGLKDE